jgi:hypothetical protein
MTSAIALIPRPINRMQTMLGPIWKRLAQSMLVGILIATSSCGPSSSTDLNSSARASEKTNSAPMPSQPQSLPPKKDSRLAQQWFYGVERVVTQSGCCDGSAGVALDEDHFLVANDENSILRVYSRRGQTSPLTQFNFRKFLDLKKSNDESDLEGMTRIGTTIYVIASHSRSKDGEKRKGRRQLLALNYQLRGGKVDLKPIGKPYTKLLKHLEESQLIDGLDFEEAARRSGDQKDGLNIEGLSSTPDGGLLIGFRAPIHQGTTILIKLENPSEVVLGEQPRFSEAKQLLLGSMGVRGIERFEDTYLLTTESDQGKTYPQLFQWNGSEQRPRRVFVSLPKKLNPESILIFPDTGLEEIHLLSDDGNEKIATNLCNEIKEETTKRFKRIVLKSRSSL